MLKLAPGQIHIWVVRCSEITDAGLLSRYQRLMNAEERARYKRYRFEKDRHRHLLTRALVRTTLSRYAVRAPGDWVFCKGDQDKPEIQNPPIPLRFNVSHSGDFVVMAVTLELDLGIDVECMERTNDVLSIARHYFSTREIDALYALPAEHQRDRFFDYWTLKEAYMKARGEGISLGLGNFSFHLAGSDDIAIRFAPAFEDDPGHWRFWLYPLAPDHRMALAWRSGPLQRDNTVQHFNTIPLMNYSLLVL